MKPGRMIVASLAISAAGLGVIAGWEGFEETAYYDVGGVPTIGYGSTTDVQIGDTITLEDAKRRLTHEVKNVYQEAVQRCVKVPLTQNEFDAYVSLTYNIGPRAFCRSTLVKLANQGDYIGACNQILRWNKVGGRVVRGLVNRRQDEYLLCMGKK